MRLVARDYISSSWFELELRDELIETVRPGQGPAQVEPGDLWVAPAFWDIQLNGRGGHSFSSPELTVEQAAAIVRAQGALGTARLCPTLITAPVDHMLHGLRTIAAACDRFPDVARAVLGIHIEGPFLSEHEGYRGAHPAAAIREPSWALFEEFQQAAGGRIVLMTLAPERDGAIDFIRRAATSGIVVALGHTAASGAVIREAVAAGARLSTHLGNGIASPLPRHPNPIWEQAALDSLSASFIADGHHLDPATLRVLATAKGPAQTILISDASPLAGLPPGRYVEWEIEPSGRIVVAGTPYLAGSNHGLETGLANLLRATGWTIEQVLATVTTNPARLLGRPAASLRKAQPGDLIVFRRPSPGAFALSKVWISGELTTDDGQLRTEN
jgi:N-acetylglucosamine-6-phosphate deacetylase